MAGRFLILEFDDKDAAESFATNPHLPHQLGFNIKAMFMKPTKFCECPDRRRQNVKNWGKGKRTGLYLCTTCKLPSIHHQRGIITRLKYVFGNNLLEN